jgi:hypothetical protein
MVNTGKRKYTKKTIMNGGAIMFSLIPFTQNGRQNIPNTRAIDGNEMLYFIDGLQDTFFNTFRSVKFSKSCSKCYLVKQGTTNVPYQLIYRDGYVYQYAANDTNRFRLVYQNHAILDRDLADFLSLPPETTWNNISWKETGYGDPELFKKWDAKLKNAIENGEISIDQLLRFFYNNGNKNKGFKADEKLERFWNVFQWKYQKQFF